MGVDGFCSDAGMEQEIAFGVSYMLTVGGRPTLPESL